MIRHRFTQSTAHTHLQVCGLHCAKVEHAQGGGGRGSGPLRHQVLQPALDGRAVEAAGVQLRNHLHGAAGQGHDTAQWAVRQVVWWRVP
jgi:hypothetical protein